MKDNKQKGKVKEVCENCDGTGEDPCFGMKCNSCGGKGIITASPLPAYSQTQVKSPDDILEGYESIRVMTDADYYEDLWPKGCVIQAMEEYAKQFRPVSSAPPISQEDEKLK